MGHNSGKFSDFPLTQAYGGVEGVCGQEIRKLFQVGVLFTQHLNHHLGRPVGGEGFRLFVPDLKRRPAFDDPAVSLKELFCLFHVEGLIRRGQIASADG